MSTKTHYTALGLVPTAAPEVIRAAYKALALIYHPDKTINLTAEERASHAAAFNKVQAAYDMLGSPSRKAAYDAELSLRAKKVHQYRSTSRSQSQAQTTPEAFSTLKRRPTVKLTTPEEKTAMRAKARQSLDHLRQKKVERDMQDVQLDIAGLKDLVQTWKQLAEENRIDPAMHAYCAIRVHEYEQKIIERERQHEEWLDKMSTAKLKPSTPTSNPRQTTPDAPEKQTPPSSTASARPSPTSRPRVPRPSSTTISSTPQVRVGRAEERKRAETEHAVAAAARAEARLPEKAQRDAAKQTLIDQKAVAVRVEKDKQKAKVDLQAQIDAERIAQARARAGGAPLGTVGAIVDDRANDKAPAMPSAVGYVAPTVVQTKVKKICGKCDGEHTSFREWRNCNTQAAPVNGDHDGNFLRAV